jgi:phosphoribosyl 1,2-cyclic phosphodiesterase
MSNDFSIKFWGVRGTVPVPGDKTIKYGGNTSCVELMCGKKRIVFDAGTGIIELGKNLSFNDTDIFFSHTHLDHIQGLPFCRPLYQKESNICLWAGHLLPEGDLEQAIGRLMISPMFPITLDAVLANIHFNDFKAGGYVTNESLKSNGISIMTMPLHHPDRATAYRVTYKNKSVCYVTDVEHVIGTLDNKLVEFIRNADVLIYDSTYDDESFTPYIGWGHSTWQQGARLATAAGVKIFAAFHHDPCINDTDIDKRLAALQVIRPNGTGIMAAEGAIIKL